MFDRFQAATPVQQVQIIAAGVCLIAAIFAGIWISFFRTSYAPLFSDLRAADASTIITELDRKKIPYRLADGGTTIQIPADMIDGTRLSLMGQDLPLHGTVGFELFNKSDMGLTDFAQKINYQRALQGELARTIMTLDGVDNARVHLSLGEDRLFRDDQVPPKASVTIRMKRGAGLGEDSAMGIKRLVAAAVPKLDAADVVILDEEGRMVSATLPAPVARIVPPAMEEKQAVEDFYQAHIRQALAAAGQPSDIAVDVQVANITTEQLSGWSPSTRDFPLQIRLSAALPLDANMQVELRSVVTRALAAPGQTDVISFGPPSSDAAPAISNTVEPARSAPKAQTLSLPAEDERGTPGWLAIGISALVVLFAALLLVRGLRAPKRLSSRKQRDFAGRLRAALNERDTRAHSRS